MENLNQPTKTPVKVVTTTEYFDNNQDGIAGLAANLEIVDKSSNKTDIKALKEKVGEMIAAQFAGNGDFIKIGNSAFFSRRDLISLTAVVHVDKKAFVFSAQFQNGSRERHDLPFTVLEGV